MKKKKDNFILIDNSLINLNNVDRIIACRNTYIGDYLRVDYSGGTYSEFPMCKESLRTKFNSIKDYFGDIKQF